MIFQLVQFISTKWLASSNAVLFQHDLKVFCIGRKRKLQKVLHNWNCLSFFFFFSFREFRNRYIYIKNCAFVPHSPGSLAWLGLIWFVPFELNEMEWLVLNSFIWDRALNKKSNQKHTHKSHLSWANNKREWECWK